MQKLARFAAGPGDAAQFTRLVAEIDIRSALPSITTPTLVLHRGDDPLVPIEQGRYLAEHIADARFVELESAVHPMYLGDSDAVLAEIEEFVTGARSAPRTDRALTTVLFSDIVRSTERAAELGDADWRTLVSEHDRMMPSIVSELGGRTVKTTGDGMLATFEGPARGVRCALAIVLAARSIGLDLRAGLHSGEVEFLDHDLAGINVHIGSRVCDLADPGHVLVTSTVKDLVAGSGIEFDDAGMHALKGVPEEWHLYAVRSA
jgi:class 3 adenylate cyclase